MNRIIQDQLDHVDTALNTLIESIASYNPSVAAANDLLAADDELTKGVNWLTKHQANHARILSLRSQVSSLNTTITNSLTTLVDTRAEILAQDITPVSETSRQVPYQLLLDYAARISRYTAPKDYRYASKGQVNTEEAAAPVNGANANTQHDESAAQNAEKEGEQPVTQAQKEAPFVPWPSEAVIKHGALGRVQEKLETGEDPVTLGSQDQVSTVKDEDLKSEKIEDTNVAAPEAPTRDPGGDRRPVNTEEKPRVFGGLDLYDPDDMDDE
ncbi:MAG: hypothetical protein HETSPECPRED_004865 [Heterodermia speciosa]|uniref:Mediator of RNA polymerase II transcription subunit 4 n=1 Tax=Heterodermia speciosa TaxID=116794 RepID=A0A8H3I547_9LECA|nr:MAG: hypothetical protein HETSPECPRED_004865 [Heterodermia speciosa]